MNSRRLDAPLCALACLAIALAGCIAFIRPKDVARSEVGTQVATRIGPERDEGASSIKPETPSVEEIVGKFGPARPRAASIAAPPPLAPAQKADWLHPVGSFEDPAGCRWLFIKDDHSGRIIKLREDGLATEDGRITDSSNGLYVIEVDSNRYSIRGR
jgi:hypothetical protein